MTLLEWQNLIFLLPMLAALGYVLLMATGLGLGEHGDVGMDHDIGVDVGHDLDVGHDIHAEMDHDIGHDAGHDAGHGPRIHLLGSMLSLLGVGKVPLSILLLSLCFLWGAAGLALNVVMGTVRIWEVIGLSALTSVVGARLVAEGLAALMPREESYHTPKDELVGLAGEVLYEVTPTSGAVRLFDPTGNLVDLDCRTREGAIKAGIRVMLDEYDRTADVFFVRECNA